MGNIFLNQHESLFKASQIKSDLLKRISAKDQKYRHIFSTISPEKKLQILSSDASNLA